MSDSLGFIVLVSNSPNYVSGVYSLAEILNVRREHLRAQV